MRASLVLLIAGAAASGACVVGSVTAVRAQEAAAARGSSVGADTLKDAEIMRRVLVREALGTRGTLGTLVRYETAATASVGWSYGGTYAECFVVPGQGATFILRTSDPVTAPSAADESADKAPEPTAWDEEAAAVDGKTVRAKATAKGAGFEAAKVEALTSRVIEQLAKFGAKIRGLGTSDAITVIVQGGASRTLAVVPTTPDANTSPVLYSRWVNSFATNEGRTVLVIRATVADCKAAADGSLSADEFKRRAAIASY